MTQDLYYIDPGYFATKYYVYTADAEAHLTSTVSLTAQGGTHVPTRYSADAHLNTAFTTQVQAGVIRPLVAYTIFTPTVRRVFGVEFTGVV